MATRKERREIGQKVAAYRKQRGLTQDQLAEKVDLTPSFLSRVETGWEGTSLNTLLDIARALGAPLPEILAADVIERKKMEDQKVRSESLKLLRKVAGPDLRVIRRILRAVGRG